MTTTKKTKEIVIIGIFSAMLVSIQYALSFIPNIQLTILLLFVFSRCLGTFKTLIIILINVIVQNIIWGSVNIIFMITMFIGYMFTPILLNIVFKKVNNIIGLALISILCSLLYCWSFILPAVLITEVSAASYIVADILFEVLMAGSSFISILWLYERLYKVLNKIIN